MSEFLKWIEIHWADMLAAIGIGGGSGLIGKKLTDKQQDIKIRSIQEKQAGMEKSLSELKTKLDTNTVLDAQLKEDLKEHRELLGRRLDSIEKSISQLIGHLLK